MSEPAEKRSPRTGSVHAELPHDSAGKHVAGSADYVDDARAPADLLHGYVGTSDCVHGRIRRLDLSAVRAFPGVVAVLTAGDIPGANQISPTHRDDEPIFADDLVSFAGQPIFAVAAESRRAARMAARLANIEYEELPAVLDIETAMENRSWVLEPHFMRRGNVEAALDGAPHRLQGEVRTGGQDHFYLEGQVSLAVPGEDNDIFLLTSSQHPAEVQQLVAESLALPANAVTVEVRRMGGGFGGKETQAAQWAIIAALLARVTTRAVKVRLDRDDDMRSTGKRHDFLIRYDVGFDADGRIHGVDFVHALRCGISADLSGPIGDRAMFHCDNAYYLPNVSVASYRCRTRPPGNAGNRAGDRCHCLLPGSRPAGGADGEPVRRRRPPGDALRHGST
jgi:xanthine dehydrogenase large subunit